MNTGPNIDAPATLTVLGGNAALSSLAALPPGGIMVTDPASSGVLTVQIVAGNTGAALSASSLGGATVAANGNTLSLSGTALEVNTALASLEVNEPASLGSDVLTLTASDSLALSGSTNIMVDIVAQTGPAFVVPPRIVTIQANMLDTISGMLLSDPIASGLAAMGLGAQESLTLTLSAVSGVLLLPGLSAARGITASGLGTGTIELSFTAADIGALNSLLAGLSFVGSKITGGEHLYYALRHVSGPLPTALTYGNIFLNITGTTAAGATLAAGSQTVLTAGGTLGGVLSGVTTGLGDIAAPGGVVIAPDASLQLPDNALTLSGTSYDYGTLGAASLDVAGTLVAGGATLGGPLVLGTAGLLDFNGLLVAGNAETQNNQLEISLAAGGVLTGNATLLAGNFSESGMITGPGTIAALGGETLLLAAGSVGGGAVLQVASGGVMVLGPLSPLYGIFTATPVTIDNSVTLNFLDTAGRGVAGGYAGTLGGAGGAFVINGPQAFSGTVTGFAPGDQLIFPGLSNFSIYNITAGSFALGGQDASGNTVSYEIHAVIPSGAVLAAGVDAQGDSSVFLRPGAATIVTAGVFAASAGVAQPLQGIALQLGAGTTQSLSLTLAAANGLISDGGAGAAQITLTGVSIEALNTALAGLTYTGTGLADTLTLTSVSAALAGLADNIYITAAAPGVVNGFGGGAFSEGQTASFGLTGGVSLFSQPAAPGALLVDGSTDFAAQLQANGISGTALVVERGAAAIFDSSATVALGGDVIIGDANGAGTLGIFTQAFSGSGNMTLAGNAAATGSDAYVPGRLSLGGSLAIGAGGQFALAGSLSAAAATLAGGGTFLASGGASAQLGTLTDAGSIILDGAAHAAAAGLDLSGALALGGTASLGITGSLNMSGTSTLQIGADATLQASTIEQLQGVISDSGLLAASGSLGAAGTVLLTGGTLAAASLTNTGTLEGYGIINAASLTNNGVILAQGGALVLGGTVDNAAHVTVMASAALDVTGGFAGAVITFMGGDAVITLDDPARFSASVANMAATDAIDLVGVAPGLVSWSSGTLSIANSQTSLVTTVPLQIAAGEPAFSLLPDGAGGSLITLGGTLPCFARGSRLLTPHGYRAVEDLKPGDPLITAAGGRRPVRWIGRRTLDLGPSAAREGLPVLILPNAFGPGQPARPLRLSPSHCVYAGGVLIPAVHLVNGATVLRERTAPAMTYYHVELDRHDILLAEGLACESYFDDGNRGALYQELGRRSPARKPFAAVVTRGARLAAVRARLHEIALGMGFSLTYWPSLRAVAAGHTAIPAISTARRGRLARFEFPAPVHAVTLFSAVACPADTDPACEDRRELGVCLRPGAGIALGQGFYPRGAQDAGVWMGRAATLRLARPAVEFTLPLAAIAQSWVKPVDAKAAPA